MKRLKLLGLSLLATLALSAVVSASAFAEPAPAIKILNALGQAEGVKFSGNSVKTTVFSILNGFAKTECPEVATEGEFEGKKLLGLVHLHWKGCTTNLGGKCTGLGDNTGLILALGTFHIVYDKLLSEGSLGAAVLFLLEHVHYTCEGGFIIGKPLILVLGEVLCLITPINAFAKKFTIKCEGTNGDPSEVKYWPGEGTTETATEIPNGLLASEDEGQTYRMSAESGEGETEASEEIKIDA